MSDYVLSGLGADQPAPDLSDLFAQLYQSAREGQEEGLPERTCTIRREGDRFRIYDEDEEQFITLPCPELPGGQLEEMVDCRPVSAVASFGREIVYGWKYRLEEDGKWGWIGSFFDQVVPPIFKDFTIVPGQAPGTFTVLAWGVEEFYPALILWHCQEEGAELQDLGGFLRGGTLSGELDWPEEGDSPREDTLFQDGPSSIFYHAGPGRPGYYWYWDEKGKYSCQFQYDNGVLSRKKDGNTVCSVAEKFDSRTCAQAVAGVEEYQSLRLLCRKEKEDGSLERAVYAVEQDGAWALALYVPVPHVSPKVKLLTPYGLTGAELLGGAYLLVEQYGQKGVFNWRESRFVVPCRFDALTLEGDAFRVTLLGQEGKLDGSGNWLETLH